MDDGAPEMSDEQFKKYLREQRRRERAVKKQLEEQELLAAAKEPRSSKTKALGEKIWLRKRPSETVESESVSQKRPRVVKCKTNPTKEGHDVGGRKQITCSEIKASPPAMPQQRQRSVSDSSDLSELSDDNDDVADDDDNLHLKSLTDEQLARVVGVKNTVTINPSRNTQASSGDGDVNSNNANTARSLFDIADNDVEMVPQLTTPICAPSQSSIARSSASSRASSRALIVSQSRGSSRASSRASGPPTSDFGDRSEDDNDDNKSDGDANGKEGGDEGDGSQESDFVIPKRRSDPQKTKNLDKKPSKREEKFEREQPTIRATTSEKEAKSTKTCDTDADNNENWPTWTHVVYAKNKKVNLLEQHEVVHGVVHKSIKLAEIDIVTRLAWPELETSREIYRRHILYQGAKAYQQEDAKAKEVKERVKGSMKYLAVLGAIVMDRLSIVRSPARASALSHIACFELGVGEVCQQRLAALLEDDYYIYPGTWQTKEFEEKNERTGKIEKRHTPIWMISDRSLIYQNPGFMETVKDAFFDSKGSFGFKYIDYFKSTLDNRPEPELTIPIVALAATGFYAALHSWSTGQFNKKAKFEGEIFNTVFEKHVRYLQQIKNDNHIAFHVIMSRLYTYATKGSGNANKTGSTSNALSVMDLSGYE